MAERRSSERLIVAPESLELIVPDAGDSIALTNVGEPRADAEDRTEPMRLSFLALLAERDPAVQARLSRRITPVLELEQVSDEDRPTDPLVLTAKFTG